MLNFSKKMNIKQYNIDSIFIRYSLLLFIAILIYIMLRLNELQKHKKEIIFLNETTKIINFISSRIYNVEYKLLLLDKYIVTKNLEGNLLELMKLLSIYSDTLKDSFITNLSWADNNKRLLIDKSILDTPIDLSFQPHMQKIESQNSIYTGNLDSNLLLNNYIIPAAFPIYNSQNKHYIGSINTHINLNKIDRTIYEFTKEHNIRYALLNSSLLSPLLHDNNFYIDNLPQLVKQIRNTDNHFDKINCKVGNIDYIIYKMHPFPFILILENSSNHLKLREYFSILLKDYALSTALALSFFILYNYILYQFIIFPFLQVYKTALAIENKEDFKIPEKLQCKEALFTLNILQKIQNSISAEKKLTTALSEENKKLSLSILELENLTKKNIIEFERKSIVKTESLDQFSSEFLAPLSAVSAISNNLTNYWDQLDNETKFELANQISFSTNKIVSLANYFAEISTLSKEKINLDLSCFDIIELIKEIIKECNFLYLDKKSISIEFYHENFPIYITADKNKFSQAIRNLFINSIKNSSENSYIAAKAVQTTIKLNDQEQLAIHFIINDISSTQTQKDLAPIFSDTLDRPSDLSLLGLKISYKIITSHYGKMWTYENKDGGNSFNFIVPLLPFNQSIETINLPSTKNLSLDKPNILVIDDEETCLGGLELMLCHSSYNLIKCNSAEEGIKFLKNNYKYISLVLLDLMMPDIYGLNVLSKIKNDKNLYKIPIILQTGVSDEAEVRKAFSMGISSFLRKPYNKNLLLLEIEKSLNGNVLKQLEK